MFDEAPPATWAGPVEFAAAYDGEQSDSDERDRDLGPATSFLYCLAQEAPIWAVDLFREVVVRVNSATVVALGCGPLEDLARHDSHDVRRIEAIEIAAREVPEFQVALANVWLGDDLPRDLRERLARVGARDFVAEEEMAEDARASYVAHREARGWGWG